MSGISNLKRVGLDSNLFIYHFEDNPDFSKVTNRVFGRLSQGKLAGLTSTISLIETLSYPLPAQVVKKITEAFFNIPNLEIVDVDHVIGIEAAKIRREYGFRLPDSIQLATALLHKAQALITNDKRLKKFRQLKIILLNQV